MGIGANPSGQQSAIYAAERNFSPQNGRFWLHENPKYSKSANHRLPLGQPRENAKKMHSILQILLYYND